MKKSAFSLACLDSAARRAARVCVEPAGGITASKPSPFMKNRTLLLLALAASAAVLPAQTNTFPETGNVGIGTTSPSHNLDVNGNARVTGYTGIGGAPVYSRALVTYAPSSLNLAAEFTENAGIHAIQIRPNYGGFNQITSDYWSGSTYLPLALSARGVTNDLVLATNGSVGIGTTTPGAKLDVRGPTNGAHVLIGEWGPNTTFSAISLNGANDIGANFYSYVGGGTYINRPAGRSILFREANIDQVIIVPGGNVGIGTMNPTHKLSVNGTIRAKEVIVDTGWADYVFAEGYRLAPLSEVEAHIKEHGRRPGVPSEAQVAQEGVSMGDMQARLLAKIEELTLHQIAQEKQLAAQSARLERLEQENAGLRNSPQRP